MPKRRRRRSFTPLFKAQVVLEILAGLNSAMPTGNWDGSWTTYTTGSGSTLRWAT